MTRGFLAALCMSAVAALLSACGGSQPTASLPSLDSQGAPTTSGRPALAGGSSAQSYLYASGELGQIYIYTYPQGQFVASLVANRYSGGECADSHGNVFVTTSNTQSESTIYEYSHGGSVPIASLADPGLAVACAIDPKSGDLAVSNWVDQSNPYSSNKGSVAVYTGAQGDPTMYDSGQYNFDFSAYDNDGNLYLVVPNEYYPEERNIVRLASGSGSFDAINLSQALYNDVSVQWDGTHVTVSSLENSFGPILIYQLKINGSEATVVRKTALRNSKERHQGQLWIQGSVVLGVDHNGHNGVSVWAYPKGGKPTYTIKKIVGRRTFGLYGLAISVAPSR